jgi:uncharacterized protein YprB with RNaseH-like and TPR domain
VNAVGTIGSGKMKIAYLDIETNYTGQFRDRRRFTDYHNQRVTVLGLRVLQGDRDSFLQLVDTGVSRITLLNALMGTDLIVTYNGRSIPDKVRGHIGFDFPVIAPQFGVVLDREFRHLDLCPACWERGLWGGQKAIERALGLSRRLAGRDGAWADAVWKKYEAIRDDTILSELLEYNREDVLMLRRIHVALSAARMRVSGRHGRQSRSEKEP